MTSGCAKRETTERISTQMTNSTERRKFHRYQVNFPCLIKESQDTKAAAHSVVRAETTNVSKTGLFMSIADPLEVGSEFNCVIQFPIESSSHAPVQMRCSCKVVRIAPQRGGGFGVAVAIEHFAFLHFVPKGVMHNAKHTSNFGLR